MCSTRDGTQGLWWQRNALHTTRHHIQNRITIQQHPERRPHQPFLIVFFFYCFIYLFFYLFHLSHMLLMIDLIFQLWVLWAWYMLTMIILMRGQPPWMIEQIFWNSTVIVICVWETLPHFQSSIRTWVAWII